MANPQDDYQPPTIQKKAAVPHGNVPRNSQAWVIGGLALVMVLVILFSGGRSPKEHPGANQTPVPVAMDPNQQRIQEYRARIDTQAKILQQEQVRLAETKEAAFRLAPPGTAASASPVYAAPSYPAPVREKSWIESEKERRDYLSLFASNVASSRRDETPKPAETNPGTSVSSDASKPHNENVATEQGGAVVKTSKTKEAMSEEKRYKLFEGTVLETVLTNRLDGSFSGPVNCMVTTNVYSNDRQRLLIPQGSRVFGEVHKVEAVGQERLAVAFHRLVMPNGRSVSLDQFQGLNQIGETGLRDQVNHRYLQIFGVSLAIGAIAGFSQANTRYGVEESATDAYRQGVSSSLSQSSLRILDRFLNVLPTFTIREGQRVKVYLSGDLLLPAYEEQSDMKEEP
jgi:type IV secretory pathway VirB10-like protein